MASAKETPRQKMIGMMYLVLTALLALNVSKEILQAFVVVNNSLERTNENFKQKTEGQYSAFDKAKKIDPAKVQHNWDKAQAVKMLSKNLVSYIEGIKKKLIVQTEGLTERQADSIHLNYVNGKDNYDIPTHIMIGESEDGSKGLSHELKNKLSAFKNQLYGFIDKKDRKDIHLGISTDDPQHTQENENWELYNFYHTPLAAAVTILSKFQNDVKKAESDVLDYLFRQINIDDFVFDTIAARVIAPSNYILLGDEYKADVFVAAFSKTQNPKVMAGDYDVVSGRFKGTPDSVYVEKGNGKYKMKPLHEGVYKWGGEITLISPQGNRRIYPFESEYIVARPALTVSADRMNVFYLGVDNPISVSVPGVANENVHPQVENGTLVKTGDGKYKVLIKTGNKCKINIVAKMQNGETKPMGSVEYRVKPLPDPVPNINKLSGSTVKISLAKLKAAQGIGVGYAESFEFDAKAEVKSYTFNFFLNGMMQPVSVNGPYFTAPVKELINKLKAGNVFYLDDIVTMGPDGIKHASNMKVQVTN